MNITLPDMLCFALYSTTHAVQHAYKPLLDSLDLTYAQYLVFILLWAEDDQTVGRLGHQLQLDSSTLTPLLKRLEQRGLVHRGRDPQDERQVRITLTDAGRALQDRAAHIPLCMLEKLDQSIDTLFTLRDQLTSLRDHLRSA